MRRRLLLAVLVCAAGAVVPLSAEPTFVNGIVLDGATLDATRQPGANEGRFGFFSDLYYDPATGDWWALSDRGPGGGTLNYQTRLQRIKLTVHPVTGKISNFQVKETIKFTDPDGLLYPYSGSPHLDGLNPYGLTGNAGLLGTSSKVRNASLSIHTPGIFLSRTHMSRLSTNSIVRPARVCLRNP